MQCNIKYKKKKFLSKQTSSAYNPFKNIYKQNIYKSKQSDDLDFLQPLRTRILRNVKGKFEIHITGKTQRDRIQSFSKPG